MADELREILDELVADCILITYSTLLLEDKKKQSSNKVYDATSEIKSLFMSKLPKKKEYDYEARREIQIYNSTITEIEKIVEEL